MIALLPLRSGAADVMAVEMAGAAMVGVLHHDTLAGTIFADTIKGGAGDDRITGGAGADTLPGGTGNDVFAFDATVIVGGITSDSTALAPDTITDFTQGQDKIDLTSLLGAYNLTWGNQTPTAFGVW